MNENWKSKGEIERERERGIESEREIKEKILEILMIQKV